MRCIIDTSTNPYWNLAAEEYLLTSSDESIFRLWRNAPSIIVGRNQNTLAQVNVAYVDEHQLPVVRRLSGGGAVFHDLGNINFSFFAPYHNDSDTAALFRTFTHPVIDALQHLGVKAYLEGRNDLKIDGKKFSGNAIAIHKNRILMHGTLLFSSRMDALRLALQEKERGSGCYSGKAVESRRATVCNISEYLPQAMSVTEFLDFLTLHIGQNAGFANRPFSPRELQEIESLRAHKYETYEWNYGQSPKYDFTAKARFQGGNLQVFLSIKKGVIEEAHLFGDYFSTAPTQEIEAALTHCLHSREAMAQCIAPLDFDSYFQNIPKDGFLDLLSGLPV